MLKKLLLLAGVMTLMGQSLASAAGTTESVPLTFAYANQTGQHLNVSQTTDDKPAAYTEAYCQPGHVLTISYEKTQKMGADSTGRNTAQNFLQDEGAIFGVNKGRADDNQSCVVAKKGAFQGYTFYTFAPSPAKGQLTDKVVKKITKHYQRKVVRQGLIAKIGKETSIALVEFQPKGKHALASIVLVSPSGILYHDLPGEIDKDHYSTWRVDDGGEILPEHFRFMFAAHSKQGYALGLEWFGAEGSSLYVLKQQKDQLVPVAHGARYTSPL
ncbi:hypothetical protein Back11_49250 [Paenibacillus baekrokdamisoli]|uniref:Uncharacterized protein n=1 Tax=Paenibacillus baekrokdamisoli TaxID=1712516 RepID=A0A3G9IXH6_9BACL|nr:hypothetical protein [Paenibacillus baekrokdamisoli]MBB3068748.1 hypothetical protein [Paenibacillus baekrokdamisoli]BBH23580.1 hypothetical protein Back11_49250 [Paenibacillus baekrokdamisoli]